MTDADLEAAWDAVHDATPEGRYVGKRSREWIAVGPTEVRCAMEMARCLDELKAGRWPK